MKFDFDDILLVPEPLTTINSRAHVNPFDNEGMLPLMTAPMDTVINGSNYHEFMNEQIYSVIPRNTIRVRTSSNKRVWLAYGLEEFVTQLLDATPPVDKIYALIDVANGHMSKVYTAADRAKKKYGDKIVLMVGNIANPITFELYAKMGVDYVRCGIGNGQGCLTTVQTGVGYPLASLIQECNNIRTEHGYTTQIVADGGFKSYSDIIKALALGADYVMLGSMLNKAFESCAPTSFTNERYTNLPIEKLSKLQLTQIPEMIKAGQLSKKFRGMSTKEVQLDWGKESIKTSEGIIKENIVEYTLAGFTENLEHYLRSAMSYTNSKNLAEFKESQIERITTAALHRFKK